MTTVYARIGEIEEMSCQFLFLKRGVETWDRNGRGREFLRRGAQKLNALDLVVVLTVGTFYSVPCFDLSLRLGVLLDNKVWRCGVLNVTSVALKSALNWVAC